jgi:EmrB/QacA subfamily drug resistance transporter
MRNRTSPIEEDEMTAPTTRPAPAAGTGTPRSQAGSPRPRVTLIVGSLAGFMIGLDATVVATALPTIHAQLHASASTLGWTVSAYSLAFAALILTGTALGDKFGRRRVFLAGFAVFTLASAACALAPTAAALIAARAVQGAGGGIATPLSLVLITEAFPAQRRGAVVGAWGAITGVAVGFGPVIGGAIVQGVAWPWVFWVNVPVGIVLVTLGRRLLAESRGPSRRLDLPGLSLATGAVFAVTDALLRGPQVGWHSGEVLGLFGIGAALAAAFALAERRSAHPMIPPRLLANPVLRATVITRFLLFATILGSAFMVPQYLQLAHGLSPLRTGLGLLPFTGPLMLIAPVAGKIADRFGERAPIVAGFALDAAGLTLLGLTVTATGGYLAVVAPLLLAGVGVGLAVPTTVSASLRAVGPQQLGLASGVGSTLQNIGGVFGVAIVAALFAGSGSYLSPAGFVHGLRPALLALAIIATLGAFTGLAVRRPATTSR